MRVRVDLSEVRGPQGVDTTSERPGSCLFCQEYVYDLNRHLCAALAGGASTVSSRR